MARAQDIVSYLQGEKVVIDVYVKNADGTVLTNPSALVFVLMEKPGDVAVAEFNSAPHCVLEDAPTGLWNIVLDYEDDLSTLQPNRMYYYTCWTKDTESNYLAQAYGKFRLILTTPPTP